MTTKIFGNKIFLDSDGVMADFEGHFLDYFGFAHNSIPDAYMWILIDSHPNFFGSLPLMEGALAMYNEICDLTWNRPIILTACPRTNYQTHAIQKIEWFHKNVDENLHVLPVMGGKNKFLFMHRKGDILIDDFEKNIDPWNTRGGVGILHKNPEKTVQTLYDIVQN